MFHTLSYGFVPVALYGLKLVLIQPSVGPEVQKSQRFNGRCVDFHLRINDDIVYPQNGDPMAYPAGLRVFQLCDYLRKRDIRRDFR